MPKSTTKKAAKAAPAPKTNVSEVDGVTVAVEDSGPRKKAPKAKPAKKAPATKVVKAKPVKANKPGKPARTPKGSTPTPSKPGAKSAKQSKTTSGKSAGTKSSGKRTAKPAVPLPPISSLKPRPDYGLSRIDVGPGEFNKSGGGKRSVQHGYYVRVRVGAKQIQKWVGDKDHGGARKCLLAAREVRDELFKGMTDEHKRAAARPQKKRAKAA